MDATINDVVIKKTPTCRLNHVEWGAELLEGAALLEGVALLCFRIAVGF